MNQPARRYGLLGFVLGVLLLPGAPRAQEERSEFARWWEENTELHGFVRSQVYFTSPNFHLDEEIQMNSWRNDLNLESLIHLYRGGDLSVSFFSVIRPSYDLIYDVYPEQFGTRRETGPFLSQLGAPALGYSNAAMRGDRSEIKARGGTHGACIDGMSCDLNQDTAFFFTGKNNPQVIIDDTIFFGVLGAPSRPRASEQEKTGGPGTAEDFVLASTGATGAPGAGLVAASLAMASRPLSTPLRSVSGAEIGSRTGLKQFPADLNATEGRLQTDCFDNANPYCMFKEFYLDFDFKNTFIRLGRQQIVWGKTDAFRLQDLINPLDLGIHNVFIPLEERRIPVLALDFVQRFGNLGPFRDFNAELVWVWDKFTPLQVGQCGEPWAFTAACEARTDNNASGLLNLSLTKVEERDWSLANTEPGFRFEGRLDQPSIAFSVSGFWGFQDAGVARFTNRYSTLNPNPAMMLFLQTLGFPAAVIPAFDPYSPASVAASSANALAVWTGSFGAGSGTPCDPGLGTPGQACADFIGASGLQPLGWIWSSSQAIYEYPRTFTLGGSLDYQIPGIDTVLRSEVAYDFGRKINNTRKPDGIDESDVILAAIGIDRSTFIRFLNPNRTAFLSGQVFLEHILSHEGGNTEGMAAHETNIITTLFMENYWRNDSIVLTNFFAYDVAAQAWITGPKLRYVLNERVFFEFGVNFLGGKSKKFNIRDICPSGALDCLGDPTTWNPGNWQLINARFSRTAEAPWWGLESFADRHMKNRDEFWFGVTYQF